MRYVLMPRRHRRRQPLPLLGCQSPALFVHQAQAGLFPPDLCLQAGGERNRPRAGGPPSAPGGRGEAASGPPGRLRGYPETWLGKKVDLLDS